MQYVCDLSVQHDPRQSRGAVSQEVTTGLRIRLGASRGVIWALVNIGLSGYENKYLEIYLRIECLGGNIGEIYHFALGDVLVPRALR